MSKEELAKQTKKDQRAVIQAPNAPSVRARKLAVALSRNRNADVADYGLRPQSEISAMSDRATKSISTGQIGDIGDQLGQLMVTLNTSMPDENENHGLLAKIIHRAKKEVYKGKAKYQSVGTTINSITKVLDQSSSKLAKNNESLSKLFEDNKRYYVEVGDYIDGGLLRLHQIDTEELPAMLEKQKNAKGADKDLVTQDLNALQSYRDRLSQRVYSLQLSQQLSLQQTAQINLIARNNNMMQDKIHDALKISVPMWKEQIAMRLAQNDLDRAIQAQKLVKQSTEHLIESNADFVHRTSVDAARQSQEAFISEDTLTHAQQELIAAVTDSQRAIEEGRQKRAGATKRLREQAENMRRQISEASRRTVDADVNDYQADHYIGDGGSDPMDDDPFNINGISDKDI